ncbi:hypothetical protein F5J12DRAFT_785521 [Pisolithus orientalis]|uniref:uncharacterized protein n=1 Tax=Pisolithus orientalis TaxID=936130 RepID=UPI002225AEF9|nr:uncharacterized protein F5J12DRAFT_786724 [Pisolithus orientalis]XP_051596365.1 uncharacterized protein F5J12DRAFT_785521 [Pisolithus orientalis]KAI5989217.1 hypothetical protein F5J12DRAFT_786724 [Pisolithus orientalis]KAI5995737.1 hypothetical protein F5J12DRAFT_785521 [Pisolithus orientalis]
MAKKPKVTLPPITWDANDHTLVWFCVNTSGKMKASIFWHIGSVLLLELYSMDAATTRDQIKHKYEGLMKLYKQHVKKHAIAGEGIGTDAEDGMDVETCTYFIEATGPNKGTPTEARNIWVTMGVGPSRKRALIMQPLAATDETAEHDDDLGLTDSQCQEIQTLQDALDESVLKAKEHIQKVTKKCTIEDTLMDIHKSNTDAINAHIQEELIIKKHQLLLEEFRADVWDWEEYQEELRKLEGGEHPGKQAQQYSPDWNLDF